MSTLKHDLFIQAQIGGDDFALVLQGKEKAVDRTIDMIVEDVIKYIGPIKEQSVFNLGDHEDGILPEALFCKKRVLHRKEGNWHYLTGEEAIPIHRSVLPEESILSLADQVEAWFQLDRGLLLYERDHPRAFRLADCLRGAFLERYPLVRPERRKTERICLGTTLSIIEGILITDSALVAVRSIESFGMGPYVALQTYKSKLRHALHLGLIVQRQVLYRGEERSLTLLTSEEGHVLRTKTSIEPVYVYPDETLYRSIIKCLRIN